MPFISKRITDRIPALISCITVLLQEHFEFNLPIIPVVTILSVQLVVVILDKSNCTASRFVNLQELKLFLPNSTTRNAAEIELL